MHIAKKAIIRFSRFSLLQKQKKFPNEIIVPYRILPCRIIAKVFTYNLAENWKESIVTVLLSSFKQREFVFDI